MGLSMKRLEIAKKAYSKESAQIFSWVLKQNISRLKPESTSTSIEYNCQHDIKLMGKRLAAI